MRAISLGCDPKSCNVPFVFYIFFNLQKYDFFFDNGCFGLFFNIKRRVKDGPKYSNSFLTYSIVILYIYLIYTLFILL